MRVIRTVNASFMRSINRSAILELIRLEGPISRTDIGGQLGISLPTVMRIVDNLLEEKLIKLSGQSAIGIGRPAGLLEYNNSDHVVIGIDLGGTKFYAAAANIGGEIYDELFIDHHQTSGEDSFRVLVSIIKKLLSSELISNKKLLGVAVGAPGVTHYSDGIIEWAPSLNWCNFPLKQRLMDIFPIPIYVDNDVNLSALGEYWFGVGKGVDNMVLITIGTGLGAGLIVKRELYRGSHNAAGEIGYILPGREALDRRYDKFGAMESIVSGSGIAERARLLLSAQEKEDSNGINSQDVFNAARRGEIWAKQILDETIDYLSITIGNIATILDPELIVLGGGVANSSDLLIDPLLRRLDGLIQHLPKVVVSNFGMRAAVMGAIALTVYASTEEIARLR